MVVLLLAVLALVLCLTVFRDGFLRLLARALVHLAYRVRARGLQHLPTTGPALVVANHVSFVDAFILGGLASRSIRFVVYHRIYDSPALNWFFRLTRAIPIAPRHEDPARTQQAFDEIDAALAQGEVIGIFPEGQLTRDGEMNRFRSGIEQILKRRPVPVVPVALRGLWGSFFSYRYGKPGRGRPRRFWSRVDVIAGKAIEPWRASAARLEATVLQLRGPAQ